MAQNSEELVYRKRKLHQNEIVYREKHVMHKLLRVGVGGKLGKSEEVKNIRRSENMILMTTNATNAILFHIISTIIKIKSTN